jgi:hypothetical protein
MSQTALKIAFKEWAVICRALAQGRQGLILRKGGIAEESGEFRLEHARFWLYPTYVHQQHTSIIAPYCPLLDDALADRPPARVVRLTHFAEIPRAYRAGTLQEALSLAGLHGWTPQAITTRFHYRTAGLYVLPARVYRVPAALELPETPVYAGCKSWVELSCELPTNQALPVLSDHAFAELLTKLADRLAGSA